MKVRVLIEMDDSGRGVRAVNVLDSAMREYNEKLSRSDAAIDFNVLGVVPEAEVRAGVVAEEPEWEYRAQHPEYTSGLKDWAYWTTLESAQETAATWGESAWLKRRVVAGPIERVPVKQEGDEP